MKKIFLILSPLLLLGVSKCSVKYPKSESIYVTDLINSVCVEYKLVDQVNVIFEYVGETELIQGGNCDRLVGYSRNSFPKIKNWARDVQK